MPVVAEVMGELGLHGAFEDGFGELLQEAVLAENVFGLLVVFQELIEQGIIDSHSTFFEWIITLLSYGHLHKPSHTLHHG